MIICVDHLHPVVHPVHAVAHAVVLHVVHPHHALRHHFLTRIIIFALF